ncbi:MFS transporter [Blastococcus brunescens]|uniref:MFS transporter n=1 Tax=Blastococcus brunescens TaxID=1564165 RepID=A0ABZ1B337_9ACTN|nr:MFS transporter [Blastococcus sp. BMG 8361]WRL65227.1 MFS transporter [Blastococcus sp. BMG 8361]
MAPPRDADPDRGHGAGVRQFLPDPRLPPRLRGGRGAAVSTAGGVTAVFLVVTVAVQATIPALTARYGVGPVLIAGLLAMGLPAPLYVLDDGLAWICALSAVRGAGFSVLTVLGATLAARVAPPERRGESVGLYGLAIAIPNLAAVPAGVALVLGGHVGWMAWLAASPVLGVLLVPRLVRSVAPEPGPGPAGSGRAAVRAALAPSAVLLLVTMAGGGVMTFLPIERPDGALATTALLVFGVTGAITRWRAGALSDRLGTRVLLPVALVVAAVGLVGTGVGLTAGDAWILVGVAVFGAGYGATQNLTLVAAFARAGERGTTTASAMWNASFDAGTAMGALVLGFLAAGIGLDWTYAVVAALLAAALPLASAAARWPSAPDRCPRPGRRSPAASG